MEKTTTMFDTVISNSTKTAFPKHERLFTRSFVLANTATLLSQPAWMFCCR